MVRSLTTVHYNMSKQTSYIKRIKLFLFGHIINIFLTELGRSVWENLDLGRWYSIGDLGQDPPIQTSRSVNKN